MRAATVFLALLLSVLFSQITLAALDDEIFCPPEQSLAGDDIQKLQATDEATLSSLKKVFDVPLPATILPPLDNKLLEKEQAKRPGMPLKIGIHRDLPTLLSSEEWEIIKGEGGKFIARLLIQSPDAIMIRPHFTRFPPENIIQVYVHGKNKNSLEGPVKKNNILKAKEFWGPPINGDRYYIECIYDNESSIQSLPVIDKISHVFVDVLSPYSNFDGAGDCENDVACRDREARDMSKGIAQLIFETPAYTGSCTGTLLADRDKSTQIPWLLTASHCGVDRTVAHNALFYFRYQNSKCNQTPPQRDDTPRVDGATHVVSYYPSDSTLLRLAHQPPAGSTFCGWRTGRIEPGIKTCCIHHPAFSYKRISDGETIDFIGYEFYHDENYITNLWTSGTTEGGSSGAPLFDRQYVIGLLTGGPGSCRSFGYYNRDYFARFSVSWHHGLSKYLGKKNRLTPHITQTPLKGPKQTECKRSGAGFTPNSIGKFYFQRADGSYKKFNQKIDATGHFAVSYRFDTPPGQYSWYGVDGPTGKKSNKVTYTITSSR